MNTSSHALKTYVDLRFGVLLLFLLKRASTKVVSVFDDETFTSHVRPDEYVNEYVIP
jgi:hypothetical protein